MLRDGFLRFCDNPEIACCKAERELENLRSENASLHAKLTASQRREKAAVEDIKLLEDCGVCKHHDLDSCDLAGTECHFEWRGPRAEKGEAE